MTDLNRDQVERVLLAAAKALSDGGASFILTARAKGDVRDFFMSGSDEGTKYYPIIKHKISVSMDHICQHAKEAEAGQPHRALEALRKIPGVKAAKVGLPD